MEFVVLNKIGDARNTGTITALRVTQDGQVLTGYASSAAPMGLAPRADNASTLGGASNRWSEIYCTNATINTSDIRDKDNIVDTDLGLNYIIKLRPVSYKWKDRVRTHQGLIAQEVEQVIHDLGKTTQDVAAFIIADTKDEDGNIVGDRYGLRYGEFIAPLIKSVQELNDRITALENK